MEDLPGRVRLARETFLFYHDRGLKDKKWYRAYPLYFMWSLFPDEGNGQHDYVIVDIWERVLYDNYPSDFISDNKPIDELMCIFDLMEQYAKNWIFS